MPRTPMKIMSTRNPWRERKCRKKCGSLRQHGNPHVQRPAWPVSDALGDQHCAGRASARSRERRRNSLSENYMTWQVHLQMLIWDLKGPNWCQNVNILLNVVASSPSLPNSAPWTSRTSFLQQVCVWGGWGRGELPMIQKVAASKPILACLWYLHKVKICCLWNLTYCFQIGATGPSGMCSFVTLAYTVFIVLVDVTRVIHPFFSALACLITTLQSWCFP